MEQQSLYWIDERFTYANNSISVPINDKDEVLKIVQLHLKKNFPEGELLFLLMWGSR